MEQGVWQRLYNTIRSYDSIVIVVIPIPIPIPITIPIPIPIPIQIPIVLDGGYKLPV